MDEGRDEEANERERQAALRFRPSEPRIHTTAELKGTKLGRHVEIGARVILRDVAVGDFSYFERNGEAAHARIGKFCSVAAGVRVNALEHPMERVTTHKISYRPNEYFRFLPVDHDFRARRRDKPVTIGNDVWIGHGAVILPGITIGDGAVIGANAVVTKDVPPYTIAAGVPAARIRERFPADIAGRLRALAWWDWPLETLFEAVPDMQALSARAFLDRWEPRQTERSASVK
ncbi:DapH/DapD/GlmU-related protein [Aurantimonas sp. VKM B-3413]|uniref:DapH/DapD/GlmU-related protein n=1 Tax=Aurantimonas sp. VKM B-3413 TaxID=2779401 RepID=UPI001E42F449|nr:antibiotic acetyltransferase [Aurantimonas sp. VKM B-3413]